MTLISGNTVLWSSMPEGLAKTGLSASVLHETAAATRSLKRGGYTRYRRRKSRHWGLPSV